MTIIDAECRIYRYVFHTSFYVYNDSYAALPRETYICDETSRGGAAFTLKYVNPCLRFEVGSHNWTLSVERPCSGH